MKNLYIPRKYQEMATQHMLDNPRCAIWAQPGLGKTASVLAALDHHYLIGRTKPTLIIAPLIVANLTWPDEIKKWGNFRHLEASIVTGDLTRRTAALKKDASLYITNFENIEWLVDNLRDKWPFEHIVVDEATRLKGFRLRQGVKRAGKLACVSHRSTQYFTELTGTPCPNGLIDLWGQIWFLDGGKRLGVSFTEFLRRWFIMGNKHYIYRPRDDAQKGIQKALQDICLTVNSKDWLNLRTPVTARRYVVLPRPARKIYEELVKKFIAELTPGVQVEAVNAATLVNKLLQVANGAVYTEDNKSFKEIHSAKLQVLESIITELAGAPVLVSYSFQSDAQRILKAFPGAEILKAGGDMESIVRRWNSGKIPVLLIHPAAAGYGVSLQDGGNTLVFFGQTWNLEHRLQVIERIGPARQKQAGHDRGVFIYDILAKDTVDERVFTFAGKKQKVQDILMEALSMNMSRAQSSYKVGID